MRKTGRGWVVLVALAILASAVSISPAVGQGPQATIDPKLEEELQTVSPGQRLSVIVTLREQADLGAFSAPELKKAERQTGVIRALQAVAERGQKDLLEELRGPKFAGQVGEVKPFWIFNGLSLEAEAGVIQVLARRPEVESIRLPEKIQMEQPIIGEAIPAYNLNQVHAPDLWALGYTGQGVVVANVDSGVNAAHPDLQASYRGGVNSWKDFTANPSPTPVDFYGHGTQTMGVMVAGSHSGQALGVAPGARWIAARVFNASGGGATEPIIQDAFQWILDPDGNVSTADAPDVINNSWSSTSAGCNLAFQADIHALRAAGIVPVFAAGNYGYEQDSSRYPANNPGAFPVGAVNSGDSIWIWDYPNASSHGPSSCPDYLGVYPRVVAPGVSIYTTNYPTITNPGLYAYATGTSLAAPHIAGALALLLSTGLPLSVEMQEKALMDTAVDLGEPGPDNTYGYGRIDVLAAYWYIRNGGFSYAYLPVVMFRYPLWMLFMPWIIK